MIRFNCVLTAISTTVLLAASTASAQFGERLQDRNPRRPVTENPGTIEFETGSSTSGSKTTDSVQSQSQTAESKVRPSASIVARVDDAVILLEDVVSTVRPQLLEAKSKLPRDQYDEVEQKLLKSATTYLIDRAILLSEIQAMIKKNGGDKDALDKMRKMAHKDFDNFLQRVGNEAKPRLTRAEVIAQFEKEGLTEAEVRRNFIDRILTEQFLIQMTKKDVREPTREDLYNYYKSHKQEFSQDAGAIWRQIEIRKSTNPEQAYAKAQEVAQRLGRGEDFGQIAKQASDGPTAASGGLWSLTSPGSYAEKVVDEAIFSLPIGQTSKILEASDSYQIIKVEKRSNGEPKPFADVQTIIRKKISDAATMATRTEKLKDMRKRHYIENIFDRLDARTATSLEKPIR